MVEDIKRAIDNNDINKLYACGFFVNSTIKEYILLTTDDDRRCEHCAELIDKKIPLSQAQVGINYPPLHPHCRCCAIAVIDKEGGQ